jgi:hypothetical protein
MIVCPGLAECSWLGTWLLIDKHAVFPYKLLLCHAVSGRNSAVECQLPKLDVTGSIPVARSKFFP